ncbi:MAG TPA: peptidoglycan-binding protein [Mycobacteriales bacterium]|nr:peptidoglycan-binding protein [Mycobacteriales bacterium]
MRPSSAWIRRNSLASALVAGLIAALSLPAIAPAAAATTPPVTTCASISAGATGAAVKTLQKTVGTTADGDFGPATKKAVKAWQKAHHVAVTGIVDAATWAALPAAVGEKACHQKVTGSGVPISCAALSSGASGLAVAVLEAAVGTSVDGKFGSATKTALENVQRTAKLHATGITNEHAWKALHLVGTPVCSTVHTVGPRPPADEKAQQKIRAKVATLAGRLVHAPGTTKNPVALQAYRFAKRQLGKPYVWGGIGPKGYDCSGLQMTSYLHAGLTIPRTAAQQYAGAGKTVPLNEAQRGDLLFYASDVTKPATVYHVVMYIGAGKIIDSPETGENVQVQSLWTTDLMPVAVRPVAGLTLPVKPGATGWTVTQLQQALNRHGASLAVDGGYGPSTESAVRKWQARHKVTANGVVRVTTWLTLG